MRLFKFLSVLFIALSTQAAFAAVSSSDAQGRVREARDSMEDLLMSAPDRAIPKDLFNAAQCVATLQIFKAGLVFGGEGGHGLASCRGASGKFGAPIFIDLAGGSFGLQIGIESVDLILVFTNKNAKQSLLSNNFKLGGEVGLTVGPVGRDLAAATNYKLQDAIYSYSTAKGIFAGLTLDGSDISLDHDYNSFVYGADSSREIFDTPHSDLPAVTLPYVNVLNQY